MFVHCTCARTGNDTRYLPHLIQPQHLSSRCHRFVSRDFIANSRGHTATCSRSITHEESLQWFLKDKGLQDTFFLTFSPIALWMPGLCIFSEVSVSCIADVTRRTRVHLETYVCQDGSLVSKSCSRAKSPDPLVWHTCSRGLDHLCVTPTFPSATARP